MMSAEMGQTSTSGMVTVTSSEETLLIVDALLVRGVVDIAGWSLAGEKVCWRVCESSAWCADVAGGSRGC
jgi:hypothetical protein